MNENARVGQGKALALGAGQQQKCAHAGRLADAVGHHVVLDELHGVVDGQAGGDGAARRVDVKLNVLFRVFAGEEEHLRDDEIGHLVVDRRAKKDDVVAKQTGVNVVGALAPARLLNHHGNQCHSSASSRSSVGGCFPLPFDGCPPGFGQFRRRAALPATACLTRAAVRTASSQFFRASFVPGF